MRLKADLCSSVFCGLTMRDVYRYWFSVGDGDEVDTHRDEKKDVLVCLRAQGKWHTSLTLVYGAVKVKRRHIKRKGETKEEEESGPTERENRGLLMLHGSRLPGLQHELPAWQRPAAAPPPPLLPSCPPTALSQQRHKQVGELCSCAYEKPRKVLSPKSEVGKLHLSFKCAPMTMFLLHRLGLVFMPT